MTAEDPAHRAAYRLANIKPPLGFPDLFHLLIKVQGSDNLGAVRWFSPQGEFFHCHMSLLQNDPGMSGKLADNR